MPEPVKLAEVIEGILNSLTEINSSLDRMVEQDKALTAELREITE